MRLDTGTAGTGAAPENAGGSVPACPAGRTARIRPVDFPVVVVESRGCR